MNVLSFIRYPWKEYKKKKQLESFFKFCDEFEKTSAEVVLDNEVWKEEKIYCIADE